MAGHSVGEQQLIALATSIPRLLAYHDYVTGLRLHTDCRRDPEDRVGEAARTLSGGAIRRKAGGGLYARALAAVANGAFILPIRDCGRDDLL